ncbi:MAG: M14 family metallopeptidase [Candidatus Aminicenantes bacterium]|nr:M14 family metallopeptidase [Candidatus Aminicenantes bacterium]
MKKRIRTIQILAALFWGVIFVGASTAAAQEKPLTVAESSRYQATSRYDDVMSFIRSLQRLSPNVRVETLARSAEGRDIPLLVLGKPLPLVPSPLRQDKRGVVYIQANIHAGEVEGKEASLVLARDILLSPDLPYLDKLIILIAPIFNADGNEKIRPENRPHQGGPKEGVGVRYNGQNLDLNRDSIKLESPELRGLVANVLLHWDPLLLIDCHTTNGSYHEEVVTYSWGLNPNGDAGILAHQRDKMMPEIETILEEKYGTPAAGYGGFRDFRAPDKGWQTFEPQPRYVTNYIGLRNRFSILDENYVYADFKARVMGNYHFLRAILDYCSAHWEEIEHLAAEADRRTVLRGLDPGPDDPFFVEYELRPLRNPVTIHAYETEVIPQGEGRRPRLRATEKVNVLTIPYYSDWIGKRRVSIPYAYVLGVPDADVAAKLRQHGLVLEKLNEAVNLEVEVFKLTEFKAAERAYQGHHLNQAKGEYALETREFPAGTIIIPTAQPLGRLAAYLLEPESDDGLLAWNFFDRYLVPQWSRELPDYPVYKLLKPVNLVKELVR